MQILSRPTGSAPVLTFPYFLAAVVVAGSASINAAFGVRLSAGHHTFLIFATTGFLLAIDLLKPYVATLKTRAARMATWLAIAVSFTASIGLWAGVRADHKAEHDKAVSIRSLAEEAKRAAEQKEKDAKADKEKAEQRQEEAGEKLATIPLPASTAELKTEVATILADPRAKTSAGLCSLPYDGVYTREHCPRLEELKTKVTEIEARNRVNKELAVRLRRDIERARATVADAQGRIEKAQSELKVSSEKLSALPMPAATSDAQAHSLAVLFSPFIKLADDQAALLVVILVAVVGELFSANALNFATALDRTDVATGCGQVAETGGKAEADVAETPIDQTRHAPTSETTTPPATDERWTKSDRAFLKKLGLDVDAGTGRVRISQRRMADHLGMDRDTLSKELDRLRSLGLEVQTGRNGTVICL